MKNEDNVVTLTTKNGTKVDYNLDTQVWHKHIEPIIPPPYDDYDSLYTTNWAWLGKFAFWSLAIGWVVKKVFVG